jgi:hypothetical protein
LALVLEAVKVLRNAATNTESQEPILWISISALKFYYRIMGYISSKTVAENYLTITEKFFGFIGTKKFLSS